MLTCCGEYKGKLANPADVPAGLETLQLNEAQAMEINKWVTDRGTIPHPSESAEFIKSLLRDDQMNAFNKLMEEGMQANPSGS